MKRRLRWNWVTWSSLLFLCLLAAYGAFRMKEIMGPAPHSPVRYDLEAEAELPPPDIASPARERWRGALGLMIAAEKNPTVENLGGAIYGFRGIAEEREFAGTAYASAARRKIAFIENLLRKIAPDRLDDPDVSGQ